LKILIKTIKIKINNYININKKLILKIEDINGKIVAEPFTPRQLIFD